MAELKEQSGNPEVDFGSDEFFNSLDKDVNGMVLDDQLGVKTTEVTQGDSGSAMETQNESQNGSDVDWEKRYKSSSQEAVKMAGQLRDLRPFVPVLEAMKRDSGLVDHVREYLTKGGKPASGIKQQLGLDDDFIYDPNEALSDPKSDSAKLMNAHVDGLVQSRVSDTLSREKQKSAKFQGLLMKKKQEADFKKKHSMTDEKYAEFVNASKQHRLSLDDIYYLVNKDKAAANTAEATKQDMLGQMKAVRDIPTSAGDSNSQPSTESGEDKVFNALVDMDENLDDLFGDLTK